MTIPVVEVSEAERDKILALHETHFCDVKSMDIKPAKLTRTIAALSNAEGGEVYVGIEEDKAARVNTWVGFNVPEDANGHLQAIEPLFPLGEGYGYTNILTLLPVRIDFPNLEAHVHGSRCQCSVEN